MVTELTTLAACKLTAQAIASIYKGAKTISDVFLARKIEKFAEEPFSEKSKEYINSMDVNKFEELQEQIIHSLTHAESVLKALYVKNLTSAYCENKIDWSTFCRMNFVLGQIYTMDLISLVKFYNYEHDEEVTQNKLNQFAGLGLVGISNIYDAEGMSLSGMYPQNEFGRKFIDCVLLDLDKESKKRIEDRQNAMMKAAKPFIRKK